MFLLGKTLEAYPTLAKEVEPVGTPAFYLAALDVLEDGENASHLVHNHRFLKEDWRLALSIGMCLTLLSITNYISSWLPICRKNTGLSCRRKAPAPLIGSLFKNFFGPYH
jgi:hypothetical protein